MPRATLENYHKAICLIRKMAAKPIGSEIPIKKTQFSSDHGVRDNIFRVLEELKAIEPLVSEHREGTIFAWVYKQASNEGDAQLASRVMALMSEKGKKYYEQYKDKGKGKEKPHTPPVVKSIEPPRGLTIKAGSNGVVVSTKKPEPVVKEIATVPEVAVAAPEPIVQVEEKNTIQTSHKAMTFTLEGSLSKEDLLRKIGILLEDQPISRFSIDVQY